MPDETYRLILKSTPNSVPATIRMRRVLKALLRAYGFRCEECLELKDERRLNQPLRDEVDTAQAEEKADWKLWHPPPREV